MSQTGREAAGTAQGVVAADTADVRVTTWTFERDGADTGHHRHEFDYVVVPITGGTFRVTNADGSVRELAQAQGVPYLGSAGTEHNVVNASGGRAVFVEIELKGSPET
jgi:quercetin dioxygenase-like cupin family protein